MRCMGTRPRTSRSRSMSLEDSRPSLPPYSAARWEANCPLKGPSESSRRGALLPVHVSSTGNGFAARLARMHQLERLAARVLEAHGRRAGGPAAAPLAEAQEDRPQLAACLGEVILEA